MDDLPFALHLMHSPEVELTEIFVSNIFKGNGLAPSDIPPTAFGSPVLMAPRYAIINW